MEAGDYRDGNGREVRSGFRSNHAAFIGGWTPDDRFRLDLSWETVTVADALFAGAGMDSPLSVSNIWIARAEWNDPSAAFSGLRLSYYQSEVEHEMDNFSLRPLAAMPMDVDTQSDTTGARLAFDLANSSIRWTSGMDFQQNSRKALRYTGPDRDNVTTLNSVMWPEARIEQYGAFSELEIGRGRNLRLELGVRYDRIRASASDADRDPPGMPMSPEALYALYYGEDADTRTEDNVSALVHLETFADERGPALYLDLSRIVRGADATERFIAANGMNPGLRWVGNPAIGPEIHHQLEMGMLESRDNWHVRVSAFYDWADDYIIRDLARGQGNILRADGAGIYRNVNAELFGAELETHWHWTANLSNQLGVAYVYAINRTDQRAIAQIPPLTANLSLDYEQIKWSAGARLRMTATQTRVDDDPRTGSGLDAGRTPGHGVFDLYGRISPLKNLDLMFGMDNVLNHNYAEHLNKPNAFDPTQIQVNEPGRMIWLKFKMSG
jgi:iron complex outermembrane receptor protein